MKLSSITIEGMHNVSKKTYNFDNVVYLYGRNGVGKSTVLQAIQLALLGYIPGTNKTKEHIFRHANTHTMAVTAVISNDDGSEIKIRRVWTGTSKSITSIVEITPEDYPLETILADLELPIFNFGEFVGMTANKLKDWFINFLPNADSELDWETLLKDAASDYKILDNTLLESIVKEANSYSDTSIENVRRLNEYLKAMLSSKKAELTRQQSTIQSLIFYEDVESTESADNIKAQIANANAKRSEAIKFATELQAYNRNMAQLDALGFSDPEYIDSRIDTLLADIPQYNSRKDDANNKLASATGALRICNESKEEITKVLRSYEVELASLNTVMSGEGTCPYTNTVCDALNEYRANVQARIDKLNSDVADCKLKLENTQTRINEITAEIAEHNKEIDTVDKAKIRVNDDIDKLSKQKDTYIKLKQSIGEKPVMDAEDADVSRWDTLVASLIDKLAKVEANIKYSELTEQLTKEKTVLEQSIEIIKIWIKLTDANGLQTKLMVAPFESLANKMNSYLKNIFPGDVSAHFYLTEKANSFSFGIMRGEHYIPFDLLSSGEKCLYTIALMMCIVYESSAPLKLIMVDDLFDHLDNENINTTFEALHKIEGLQFILAGVKPCNVPDAAHIVKEVI